MDLSEAQEAIMANAAHHSRLLTAIGDLGDVPSAKEHQISYIDDLEDQLATIQEEVAQLFKKTKEGKEEHETLKGSTGKKKKKIAHKAKPAKVKNEERERENIEALKREIARDVAIQRLLEDAHNELTNLTEKEEQLQSAIVELTAIYDLVFDGPSESFPEDDRLEYDFHAEKKRHDEIQKTLDDESLAIEDLTEAVRLVDACQSSMQKALNKSYNDKSKGSMDIMAVKIALMDAQDNASQAEILVGQATRASRWVQPIGRLDIARVSLTYGDFFDDRSSDVSLYDKIRRLGAQVVRYNQRLRAEWDSAQDRADEVDARLVQASKDFDRCRKELYAFRKATFESYVAQNPPPPCYDAVIADMKPAAITNKNNTTNTTSSTSNPLSSPSPLYAEKLSSPLTSSPPRIETSSPSPPIVPPKPWGSRNPYAAAMAEAMWIG